MGVRILNVIEAPAGVTRRSMPKGERGAADLSLAPCTECPSRCCSMTVVVSTVEALRLARVLGLALDFSVEPTPWTRELGLLYAWPFKLDDGRRYVFRLVREGGFCRHLVRPGREHSRCGVYELRPANCRLYPFVVERKGEALPFGSQVHCPVQWMQNDELRARVAADADRWRAEKELDIEVVRFWNRGRRERTLERWLAFLSTEAQRALAESRYAAPP